jgi:hypothetical protein
MKTIEATDRYQSLNPNPEAMCAGDCEGMRLVPVKADDDSPEYRRLWQQAHDREPHVCDGWHFVDCLDCGGTGLKSSG